MQKYNLHEINLHDIKCTNVCIDISLKNILGSLHTLSIVETVFKNELILVCVPLLYYTIFCYILLITAM
jgi:hypothetical protein